MGDERQENQAKAAYLLAKFAHHLIDTRDYQNILFITFKQLAKCILERQYSQKGQNLIFTNKLEAIVQRFYALGKFANLKPKGQGSSTSVMDVIIYILYEELKMILKYSRPLGTEPAHQILPSHLHLVVAILECLNHDIVVNESNKRVIGSLFRKFVYPFMDSPHSKIQKAAIQFSWYILLN